MSDENTTETTEQTGQADTETVEALNARIAELEASNAKLTADVEKWTGLSRKNEDRAKENADKAKRLDELEPEVQRLATENDELKGNLSAKDREVLVERVAASKGVKAKYLSGDTEDELNASADEFLADIQGIAPERPSGIVPSSGTGDPNARVDTVADAKARAAAKYGVSK